MSGVGRRRGEVVEFDEAAGLGQVELVGGGGETGSRYLFHCTQIADGTRAIPVGTAVTFVVIAGHGGRWQAGEIRRDPEPPA